MRHIASGNYRQAELCLKDSIKLSETKSEREQTAFLIQRLGQLYLHQGDLPKAVESYERYVAVAEDSLITMIHYAIFLAGSIHDYHSAIQMCNRVINKTSVISDIHIEGELSRDFYLADCYSIIGYSYCMINDFDHATITLRHLLKLHYVIHDYAVKFCEEMIKMNLMVDEAKTYLKLIIDNITSEGKQGDYQEFIDHLNSLIGRPTSSPGRC